MLRYLRGFEKKIIWLTVPGVGSPQLCRSMFMLVFPTNNLVTFVVDKKRWPYRLDRVYIPACGRHNLCIPERPVGRSLRAVHEVTTLWVPLHGEKFLGPDVLQGIATCSCTTNKPLWKYNGKGALISICLYLMYIGSSNTDCMPFALDHQSNCTRRRRLVSEPTRHPWSESFQEP